MYKMVQFAAGVSSQADRDNTKEPPPLLGLTHRAADLSVSAY